MATLMLTAGSDRLTSPSLRTWLGADWAILFSHPDDFVSYDLEMDRWLVITRKAFADRGIQPIALEAPTLDGECSWVSQVSGDSRAILLENPTQQHFGLVDLQVPVLREQIEAPGRRFVMIIDSALRIQKTFTYQSLSNLPSPLELLGWAEALRAKQTAALPARTPTLCSSSYARRPSLYRAHGRLYQKSSPACHHYGTW